jgi:hypothetical protein
MVNCPPALHSQLSGCILYPYILQHSSAVAVAVAATAAPRPCAAMRARLLAARRVGRFIIMIMAYIL